MTEIELQAILFDLDGTLIDSEETYAEIFRQWLWEQHVSFDLQDEVTKQIQPGITWGDCIYLASAITKKKFDPRKAQREIFNLIEQHILDVGLPLKEGARAALETLGQQYRLAVVSSSPHKVVERALRHHGLYEHFAVVTALEDIQYPKPHPEPYLRTLAELKLKPEQTVAMEDSLSGAQSAAAAGIFVYTWPDNHFKAEQFDRFGKVIYSFSELMHDVL